MLKAIHLHRIVCFVLIAIFSLCPATVAENVQTADTETVYLTEAARRILGEDLDERFDGAEEGVKDMRYVILEEGGEETIVGIRLRYPSAVELSALSVDTYEVVDYPHGGVFVNSSGLWGYAETSGAYVFLIFKETVPLRALLDAYELQEAEIAAQWGFSPECGPEIAIWQKETIWLTNGSYVPMHMFFAVEGLYPGGEPAQIKNSMRREGAARSRCRCRECRGEREERAGGEFGGAAP